MDFASKNLNNSVMCLCSIVVFGRVTLSFILLSHQRSASSFLMNILRSNPQINMLNEPLGQHIELFREYDLFNISNFPLWLVDETISLQEINSYLGDLKVWLSGKSQIRGIKEVLLLNKIEWVLKTFGNERIIVLFRDPRGIIASLYNRGLDLRWNYKLYLETYMNSSSAPIEINFDLDDRIHVCAVVWKLRVSAAIASISRSISSDILRVRTEDIFDNFEDSLSGICEHIGIEIHSNQINYWNECLSSTRGGLFSDYHEKGWLYAWQHRLRPDHIKSIEHIAGEEMEKLGYL